MGTFLWVLQFSGVGIALVGLRRERWLRGRTLARGEAAAGPARRRGCAP